MHTTALGSERSPLRSGSAFHGAENLHTTAQRITADVHDCPTALRVTAMTTYCAALTMTAMRIHTTALWRRRKPRHSGSRLRGPTRCRCGEEGENNDSKDHGDEDRPDGAAKKREKALNEHVDPGLKKKSIGRGRSRGLSGPAPPRIYFLIFFPTLTLTFCMSLTFCMFSIFFDLIGNEIDISMIFES